jgi:hypothetical protein
MTRRRIVSPRVASSRLALIARLALMERRQDLSENYFETRLRHLDHALDRAIALDQSRTGRRQLAVARISVAIGVLLFFAGMLTTFVLLRIH